MSVKPQKLLGFDFEIILDTQKRKKSARMGFGLKLNFNYELMCFSGFGKEVCLI